MVCVVCVRVRVVCCVLCVRRYDKDHSGTIDAWELRQVLESMGQKPTDEEIFNLISTVDEDMSQTIDFPCLLYTSPSPRDRG